MKETVLDCCVRSRVTVFVVNRGGRYRDSVADLSPNFFGIVDLSTAEFLTYRVANNNVIRARLP